MMLFIFFCFAGLFIMFFFILRCQEKFQESMREECAELRLLLRGVDARLAVLTGEAPEACSATPERLDILSMGEKPDGASVGDELDPRFYPQGRRRR